MIKAMTQPMRFLATAATILLSTAGAARADVRLQGAGATFPAPIYQRWVTEYQTQHPEVKIDYQSIGSGGGIKGITEKTVDFGASDAPMNKKEVAAVGGEDKILQIPTVAGAVVVAYNLPEFQGELKLDGTTVADIFLGKITKWNDAKIAALNEGAKLPDMPITSAHRTDGSGTTYVFTSYLATQSDEFKEKVGGAKQVEWPGGQGGKGNEGVTQVVQQTKGSIGYIELAYAVQNKIPFATMKNKDGKFVKASPESVSAAGEGALEQMSKGLAVNIWNQPGEKAYPISAFTYIIVYKDLGYLKDAAKAKAMVGFLNWATTQQGGQQLAASLDYAPLSEGVQKKVAEAIATLAWDGKPLAAAR
ncbi:MAG TPA: phosphate ABC transporter substrate-binding protein PstS [Tepidisphaeraceae bacterium]|nr:phosphate ABC transporter substrate-binding protein PstS [Tepidisphaeraceae bacterium]